MALNTRGYKERLSRDGQLQLYIRGAWRKPVEAECWYCGVTFLCRPGNGDTGHFCSLSCSGKHKAKYYLSKSATKPCVICGRPFRYRRAHAERHTTCGRVYCVRENRSRHALRRHETEKLWGKEKKDGTFAKIPD